MSFGRFLLAVESISSWQEYYKIECLLSQSWVIGSRTSFLFLINWGPNFLWNESSQSSQIYLWPEKLRQMLTFHFEWWNWPIDLVDYFANWIKNQQSHSTAWKFHIICTIFGNARAVSNFCRYLRKCGFLASISKPAGFMHSRLVTKVILHWYRPKLISETIKCGGGTKIWFHGWLCEKKKHHFRCLVQFLVDWTEDREFPAKIIKTEWFSNLQLHLSSR